MPDRQDYIIEALQNQLIHVSEERDRLEQMIEFNPRAKNLLRKRRPFLVVALDEPYAADVYKMIREHEVWQGTWTDADEWAYERFLNPREQA